MGEFNILLLPGDGIGPEVTESATQVLDSVAAKFGHSFHYESDLVGGSAIDAYGVPLLDSTINTAKKSDAVLFGSVGGPKWDDAEIRPEAAIIGLRKSLGLFANIRPVRVAPGMEDASPVKNDRVRNTDMIIIRELTGGLYYGKPKRRWANKAGRMAVDSMVYSEREVDRIIRVAFELARGRKKKVTSVDKANVLQVGRMWREIANEIALDYPDVELEHQLADSCAMLLVTKPSDFDVLVTSNMFGDILSDEAAILTASLGMLPSASLAGLPSIGSLGTRKVRGLYEPIHGTAPDIAGSGKANPIGEIVSAAFMLRYSFGMELEAKAIEQSVEGVLAEGLRTADIASSNESWVTTSEMTAAIVAGVKSI